MTNCCDQLKKVSPQLSAHCHKLEAKGENVCLLADTDHLQVDYHSDPPQHRAYLADGEVTPFELLAKLISISQLPTSISTKRIPSSDSNVWPWTLPDILDLGWIEKAKVLPANKRLSAIVDFISKNIKYLPHLEPVGDAKTTLTRGYGNCLELSLLFYGLSKQLGLDAHFVIQYSKLEPFFHIINSVQLGNETLYFDFSSNNPTKISTNQHTYIDIDPAYAYIYFMVESTLTDTKQTPEKKIEQMTTLHSWIPLDFHLPFAMATYLSGKDEAASATWLSVVRHLNPHFVPAKKIKHPQ